MTVSTAGVRSGTADGAYVGYWLLRADDIDGAVALPGDHPFVARGGSLQVTVASASPAASSRRAPPPTTSGSARIVPAYGRAAG